MMHIYLDPDSSFYLLFTSSPSAALVKEQKPGIQF